jgi:hypothetical protein
MIGMPWVIMKRMIRKMVKMHERAQSRRLDSMIFSTIFLAGFPGNLYPSDNDILPVKT